MHTHTDKVDEDIHSSEKHGNTLQGQTAVKEGVTKNHSVSMSASPSINSEYNTHHHSINLEAK